MPARLTPVTVATPAASVGAPPTPRPFSVKLMDLPFTPLPPAASIADRFVVPPKAPEAALIASVVAAISA